MADACVGMVEDLATRWELPAVYLLVEGRVRCQASRGYFQVSDGYTTDVGIVGRVMRTGLPIVLDDVSADPAFIGAIAGLQSEVCFPIWMGDVVVGAVNLESRGDLGSSAVDELRAAAEFLGHQLTRFGGPPRASIAERLARITIELSGETSVDRVVSAAVEGARDLSGMGSAALAELGPDGWAVRWAVGPLTEVLQGWDDACLEVLNSWVWAGTSSYFPDGESVPPGYEFLSGKVHALSVQPMVVAGTNTGLLLTADTRTSVHDPALTSALEMLAGHAAATLAMTRTMETLAHQANHDSLTGLGNRRALLDALENDLARRTPSALVLLDLDGFKAVNDQHGHAAGDTLLRIVAQRLLANARQRDLVVRLGGDEFAVLVRDVHDAEQAAVVGQRFLAATTSGTRGTGTPGISASAGVRLLAGDDPSTLLVDADSALYAAKHAGKSRLVVWEQRLRQEVLDADELVADLLHALKHDELTLAYQPVANTRTLQIHGVEALARWHHPVRGQVPPIAFVAAAERAGIVGEITRWALRTACRQALVWPELKVGINISAAQLGDDTVVDDVDRALRAAGVPADRLVLEVTETFAVQDLPRAKKTLEMLRDLGVTLALDDFGTGYSSLTHAHTLPFHILKVDRSFVAAAAIGDKGALATISAVCALAARLQVDVVAEGVEDQAQLEDLALLGCGNAQGYALSRPVSADEICRLLAAGGYLNRAAVADLPRQDRSPAAVSS